jgi:hypothetical protein
MYPSWLTVKEASEILNCSVQYVRYLIAGRNRKYPNRIKTDDGVIPKSLIKIDGTPKKPKYLIHEFAVQTLKQIKNNKK